MLSLFNITQNIICSDSEQSVFVQKRFGDKDKRSKVNNVEISEDQSSDFFKDVVPLKDSLAKLLIAESNESSKDKIKTKSGEECYPELDKLSDFSSFKHDSVTNNENANDNLIDEINFNSKQFDEHLKNFQDCNDEDSLGSYNEDDFEIKGRTDSRNNTYEQEYEKIMDELELQSRTPRCDFYDDLPVESKSSVKQTANDEGTINSDNNSMEVNLSSRLFKAKDSPTKELNIQEEDDFEEFSENKTFSSHDE